ncbi:hypothetical protein HPO96_21280 [Kribbella sandramycini]|uniref:DNA-directed RNA polymerase specialized sigma24 family protein n=1 Tax=Kribbella sandramycini TaxID=60450 RepID=A0A7Y4L405_9ACTN|nr:hypothetical protein [Kribbella sandramycini]MBB6566562.1 hypothetical protein [Kribbella sandramycini]NOL42781.1 hypothetical protein [Kribbella sandramycini]
MRREHAENLVGELYDSLVFVAFQATSSRLGRHRRVLIAHSVVQRLPQLVYGDAAPELYGVAIREALRAEEKRRWVRIRGLQFFPMSESLEPLQLEESLRVLAPEVRAAWALRQRAGLDDATTLAILQTAGVSAATAVLAAAQLVTAPVDQVFDPCAVKLAPEWQPPKRRRPWILALPLVLIAAGLSIWGLSRDADRPATAAEPVAQKFSTTQADLWRRTSKLDFSAWSTRGALAQDNQLQERVWRFWQAGQGVTAADGTTPAAPAERPSLLYAGRLGDAVVVLMYDGARVARYRQTGAGEELRVDRVDSADLMTSAAVVLERTSAGPRYLLAPWIAGVAVRDLSTRGASRPLAVKDGVTAAVRDGGRGCRSRNVLELRSSSAVAEKHAFVLADLGDLMPAHLTYMPLPSRGAARSPREVLSRDARTSWALHACGLDAWHNRGVRLVNSWHFAEQQLPTGGTARWTCLRVDGWSGRGDAAIRLEPPTGPAQPVATAANTSNCSRFAQNIAAATVWRNFVIAAGSRHVAQLRFETSRGTSSLTSPAAFPLRAGTTISSVRAQLNNGKSITALTSPALRP